MKTVEEIQKTNSTEELNLFEMQLYLVIKRLLIMYYNNQISLEEAKKIKSKAIKEYENQIFLYEIYQQHIENIKKTENLRIKLRKQLNSNTEVNDVLNTAIELIQLYSGEEFI